MEPPPPLPASPPPAPKRDWWSRNWKWFIPTGCLTLIVLICAFAVTIALMVFTALKSTEPYQHAVSRAKAEPRVITALGIPITEGWFVAGSTEMSGASGKSDISIPIRGPKGTATIYVLANKFAGEWQYSKLVVKIDQTGQQINLTEPIPNK